MLRTSLAAPRPSGAGDRRSRRPAARGQPRTPGASRTCACGGGCPTCRAPRAGDVRPPGAGRPLPGSVQGDFAPRLGLPLDRVRVHVDDPRPARIGAAAYAIGSDVVFGPGRYRPDSPDGRRLLAHELAHVAQQATADPAAPVELGRAADGFEREAERAAGQIAAPGAAIGPGAAPVPLTRRRAPALQRRLLADGSEDDIDGLLAILAGASGLQLTRNPLSTEIDIAGGAPGAPTSPALAALLMRIVNDQDQDAEIHVGQAQPRVLGGAFPVPHDLTGGMVQRIDLDDIRALDAGNPGFGAAALAHEIEENYQAHGASVRPGVDRYEAAHRQAIRSEGDVAEETVGPGRRVARAEVGDDSTTPNRITYSVDYETYYLVIVATIDPQTDQASVASTTRATRVVVDERAIDRFAIGSPFPPTRGLGAIATLLADNPLATVTLEGHADSTGDEERNLDLSTRRAEATRDALIRAGVEPSRGKERFNIIGRGTADPVAEDDSADGRARNRRVVVTITRPGP